MTKTTLILGLALCAAAATSANARLSATPAGESRQDAQVDAGARYATHDMPAAASTTESAPAEAAPAPKANGAATGRHHSLRRRHPH